MARPGRPERNRAARSFRQLRRFHHVINSDKVFGTHKGRSLALASILQSLAAAEIAIALHLRDFRSPEYSSFSTQSAKSGHSRAVAVEPVIPGRPAKRGRTRNPSLGGAPPSRAASPKTAPPFARDGRVRPPEATAERTPKLHRLGPADSRTTIVESDCPTGVWSLDASPRTTQPCFTIGHA